MAITGRYGAPAAGDLLTVSFDSRYLVRLTDSETRRFRAGLQGQLKRAHDKISSRLQLAVADKLDQEMEAHTPHRPQRPGARLRSAITAEENRSVTATGFSVGFEAWMNRSPAKLYWRGIEEGIGSYVTRAFFTDVWPGGRLFGPNMGGPHMRMPQLEGGISVSVKAFPGYHYFRQLPAIFGRMDVASFYRAEGVPIEQFKGVGKK